MKKRNGCTVIAGCGRLGASIAGKLSEEKKDVMVLDCDKTAFRKLPYSYGGLTLTVSDQIYQHHTKLSVFFSHPQKQKRNQKKRHKKALIII